jgi:NDP-sugar pyrophosphorylase family protein
MKAMILAAGLGTRLRPLTNDRPKALVDIAGRTPLEITLIRLREFGIRDVIVNAHHFADMVAQYLGDHKNFGMHIEISREDELLDTGGGVKKVADFFLDSGGADEPFILHNVDVISNIDLERMVKFHTERQALATLAVQDRKTSRYLLFDDASQLCGRKPGKDGSTELVRPSEHLHPLAFNGIHIISPRLLTLMTEESAFSIITTYLRLAANGEKILGFRAHDYYWLDLGTPENVAQAAQDLRTGRISLGM